MINFKKWLEMATLTTAVATVPMMLFAPRKRKRKKKVNENTGYGMAILTHYSKNDADSFVLDPQYFGKSFFTKNDRKLSDFPRVFFYLDQNDKEDFFKEGYNKYQTIVPMSQIYDIKTDIKKFIEEVMAENNGILNWTKLFEKVRDSGYNGVTYPVHDWPVVAWFDKIRVEKV